MKRVLVISDYWPPSGGGGVMRWLKFAKYLPSQGWQPVIFTPENPDPSVMDESLLKEIPAEAEVIKLPIWEPYDVYRKLTGKKREEKFITGYIAEITSKGWKNKLFVFLRGNFLIPDPRKFWVKPAVKHLTAYLKKHPVDMIVTTGPPHSMHLIGMKLRSRFAIPWLADFRDPWTNIDFYSSLRLTRWADRKHRSLEKKVITRADIVSTVSWSWAADLKEIAERDIEVITNGFDPEDFPSGALEIDPHFSLTHIGSMNKDRNPVVFWKALSDKARSDEGFRQDLRLRFYGQTDPVVFESLKECGLMDHCEDFGQVDHWISLEALGRSQVVLLPLNNAPNVSGIIPGKLFEYLATRRPMIVIGPDSGDTARIVRETATGKMAGFNDYAALRAIIDDYYRMYREKTLTSALAEINKYSRKELTVRLVEVFEKTKK